MAASETSALFQPIRIGSVEVRNRVILGPMALMDAQPPGFASIQTRAFYAERAAGGVGLIITGGSVATRWAWEAAAFPNVLRFDSNETLASLSEVAETVHRHDTKIFAQLMQGYGRGGTQRTRGVRSAAASEVPLIAEKGFSIPGFTERYVGETPRELKIDEIREIESQMGEAAARAKRAGFDGVEVPCFVGYLGASFLSPALNKRTDEYGGSFENRTRFIINNVRRIKEMAGNDFTVGVRLTCCDHVKGGIEMEESVRFAEILEAEGVDYISLFMGGYEVMELTASVSDGLMLEYGYPQAFKRAVDIPIIIPGIHDPRNASATVAAGHADLISVTRPLLADPLWAEKARLGRSDEINKCDRNNSCISRLFRGLPVRCSQNPQMGWERNNSVRAGHSNFPEVVDA